MYPVHESRDGVTAKRRARVSIRTKLMLVLLLSCAPMVGLVGWFGLATASNLLRNQAILAMSEHARFEARPLEEAIASGVADARYLSLVEDVQLLAVAAAGGRSVTELRLHVSESFLALAESAGLYSEIRLLDPDGRERASVEFGPQGARIVPEGELHRQVQAPLLPAVLRLPRGGVFVSPLHLARRDSERPTGDRAVIRFAAPVLRGGRVLGAVVLTADVTQRLPLGAYAGGSTFLVDPDGWYLHHTRAEIAWSGPQDRNTGHHLVRDFGSDAALILQPIGGVVRTQGSILATYPVSFGDVRAGQFVVLCVQASEAAILAPVTDYRRFFWVVLSVSFIAPLLAGVALGTFFLRPMRRLREGVRTIAEGDFDTTLAVNSADEFELLADDFNAMAQRLKAYRQEERLAVVGRMAATIIHDIKNPLAALTVMAQLVAKQELTTEQRADLAQRVKAQSERILSMLQEILDFSRSGRADITVCSHRLSELLADLATELDPRCAELGVTVDWAVAADCTVAADAQKLRRALGNIIINAAEATGEGGTVTVRSECDPQGVTIIIADSGPGIPEEIRDRIFEPFLTHGKEHGTGLGLAIAQAVIQAHGGRAQAANRAEGGAVFTVWLPNVDHYSDECPLDTGEHSRRD